MTFTSRMFTRSGLLILASTLVVAVGLPATTASAVDAPIYDYSNRGSSPLRVGTGGGTVLYLYGARNVLEGATATFTPYDQSQSSATVTGVPVATFDPDTAAVTAPAMPAGPVKITLFNPGSAASATFMTVAYGDTIVELPVTCTETSIALNANVGDFIRLVPSGACSDTWVRNPGWNPEGKWSVGAMGNLSPAPASSFGYLVAQHPLSRVGSFTNPAYWPTTQPGLAQSEYGSWHPVVGSDWDDPNWTGGYNLFSNDPTGIMLQVNASTTVGDNVAFLYDRAGVLDPGVQIPIVYAGGRIDPPAPAPAPVPEPTITPTVAPIVIPTTPPVAAPVELPAGTAGAMVNGVSTPVTMSTAPGGNAVVVSAGGVSVQVGATSGDGAPLPLAPDGSVIVRETGGVQMGGAGFSPNSTVSLFLYSTPTKLGELPVSASGSYGGSALIPAGVAAGSHTIQAVGYTPNGETLALSVGVTVTPVAAPVKSAPVVRGAEGSAKAGSAFKISVVGAQPRCPVRFWIRGSSATAKAGVAGRASAVLRAPSAPGTWAVTATVSGAGCERTVSATKIKVTRSQRVVVKW